MGRFAKYNRKQLNKQLRWHILRGKSRNNEQEKEERIIKQKHQHWLYVQIAEQLIFIILFVANAVTTEVNWLLKSWQLFNTGNFVINISSNQLSSKHSL